MFAFTTAQGTAAAETALCGDCATAKNLSHIMEAFPSDLDGTARLTECSSNDALECMCCGEAED